MSLERRMVSITRERDRACFVWRLEIPFTSSIVLHFQTVLIFRTELIIQSNHGVFGFADPASQQFRARAALAERAGARRAKARSRDTEAAEDRERRNYSRFAVRKKKRVAVRRWTKDPPARK